MIYSGELSSHLSSGIGLALIGAVILGVTLTFTSSIKGVVATPQDKPAAIFALLSASMATAMGATHSDQEIFVTIVAVIALSTLLTGVFFFLLGSLKLGSLIRFIPYPVIGGFMAGTGWLLIMGGFGVMLNAPFTTDSVDMLLSYDKALVWAPGLLLGVSLLGVMRIADHYLVFPSMLVVGAILFYMVIFFSGVDLSEVMERGFLLGPFPEGELWRPVSLSSFSLIDWRVVSGALPSIGTVVIINVGSILLYISSIELVMQKDIDLDQELRSAGISNLFAGASFGMPGYHVLSLTILNHKMKADSRLVSLISCAVLVAVILAGTATLSYFPRAVVGALLLFLGFDLVFEWLYEAKRKLSQSDYLVVVLVFVSVAGYGFLEGIMVGVIAGVILFVVNYSRISVVKHSLSGSDYHSNVDRAQPLMTILKEQGKRILIMKLEGYLFFGTSEEILSMIRRHFRKSVHPPLEYVVLDFNHVHGIDSSAVQSFIRLKQFAEVDGIKLAFAKISDDFVNKMRSGGFPLGGNVNASVFENLDAALEWCENDLLQKVATKEDTSHTSMKDKLLLDFKDVSMVDRFLAFMDVINVDGGFELIEQGDESDHLYFLDSGELSVYLNLVGRETVRIRTMGPGTFVGEVGMYTGLPRTASVVTEQPSVLHVLSATGLASMEKSDPEVAASFHSYMARRLSERIASMNKLLSAVMDQEG